MRPASELAAEVREALRTGWRGSTPALTALAELEARLTRAEEALGMALDCKGSYNGTVSKRGGEPAICTKCEAIARAALSGEASA